MRDEGQERTFTSGMTQAYKELVRPLLYILSKMLWKNICSLKSLGNPVRFEVIKQLPMYSRSI